MDVFNDIFCGKKLFLSGEEINLVISSIQDKNNLKGEVRGEERRGGERRGGK